MVSKRQSLPFLALALAMLSVAAGRKPKMLVSFHVEVEAEVAAADEPGKFTVPLVLGNPPRRFHFKKMPELTNRQVAGFYPFPARNKAGFGAAFKLDTQGQDRLQALTAVNSGKRLLTAVNTRPVNFVVIDQAINHGYIVVWSGLKQEDIDAFRKSIPEIVPPAPAEAGDAWNPDNPDGAGTPAGMAEKKGKKRGIFGGLFGKERKTAKPAADGADDFAPIPDEGDGG